MVRKKWVVLALIAACTGCYYEWQVRATGNQFQWKGDLGNYYDLLGRGFAGGHLYVPIDPEPKLLAQPNPWDPNVNPDLKMHDMVLFNKHYYLYHGAAPAVLLFAPWRLIARHDLPENFGVFLLCFGGFLFSCATLLRLSPQTPTWFLAFLLLALGFCQGIPYLLNRVWVYEVAIGGGYFCVSAGLYFLVRGWPAAAGLMFGFAVGCRPHLIVVGLAALVWTSRRRALLIPFAAVGLVIAAYNFARFGNPFEFGLRYLLAGGPNQNNLHLAWRHILPGLYHFVLAAPDFSPVFPWVRVVPRLPFGLPNPPGYFYEPTVGALWLAPFALLARRSQISVILWVSAGAILLFLSATAFTTERYIVDFLPLLVLSSVSLRRRALQIAMALLICFGMVVNLALGIRGPFDDMLKNKPQSYVKLARWFSPTERVRPVLDPAVDVEIVVDLPPALYRQPLVTIGERHFVMVERIDSGMRVVQQSDGTGIKTDVPAPSGPVHFHIGYSPATHKLITEAEGKQVLSQDVPQLIAAPVQVTPGENRVDDSVGDARYTARIYSQSVRFGATR